MSRTNQGIRIPLLVDSDEGRKNAAALADTLKNLAGASDEAIDALDNVSDKSKAAFKAARDEAKATSEAADTAASAFNAAKADLEEKTRLYEESKQAVRDASTEEKEAARVARDAAKSAVTDAMKVAEARKKESQAALAAAKTAGTAMQSAMAKVSYEATEAEREVSAAFRALGASSDAAFDRQEDRATSAFETIKNSGTATPKEIERAYGAMQDKLKRINETIEKQSKTAFQRMAEHASQQLDTIGRGLKSAGSTLSMSVTAPVTVGLGGLVKMAADFETSMQNVRALLRGTSEEDLQKLEDKARDLGKTGMFSATQVAGAMEKLASMGLSSEQILGGGIQAVVNAATASGSTIEDTAELVTVATKTWNLDLDQIGEVANRLTGVMDVSKFSAKDLLDAISQGGVTAKESNMSFDEFATTIAVLGDTIKSGSDAGTSFKAMLQGVTKDGADALSAQQSLLQNEEEVAKLARKNVGDLFDIQTGKLAKAVEDLEGGGDRFIDLYRTLTKNFAAEGANFDDGLEAVLTATNGKAKNLSKDQFDLLRNLSESQKSHLRGLTDDQRDILREELAKIDGALGDKALDERLRIIDRFKRQYAESTSKMTTEVARIKKEAQAEIDAIMATGYDVKTGEKIDFTSTLENLRQVTAGMTKLQRDAYLLEKYGTDASRAVGILLEKYSQEAEDKVLNGDAAASAAIRMEGFNASVTKLKNAFVELGIAIGESGLLQDVTELVNKITEFVGTMSESEKGTLKWGVGIALAAAAIGPILGILGSFVSGLGMLALAAAAADVALLPIIATVGLVVAALAGITAVALYFREDEPRRVSRRQVGLSPTRRHGGWPARRSSGLRLRRVGCGRSARAVGGC